MERGKNGKATIELRMPLDDSWDVIVAGGGRAVCTAAIAAARVERE